MATAERGDSAEVAVVEGQQAGGTEPSRQDDNRSVCQPEFKVGVLLVQARGQCVLLWGQSRYQESPRRHVTQERPGRLSSPATPDQVVRFGRDRGWHDQFTLLLSQQFADPGVKRVMGVSEGDQGSGVDDERHAPNPASSSSSGTSATDDPSPSHAPSRAKSRGAVCAVSYAARANRITSAWLRPSAAARRLSRSTSESSR